MTRKPRSAFSVDTKSPNHSPSPDRYRQVGLCESTTETAGLRAIWTLSLESLSKNVFAAGLVRDSIFGSSIAVSPPPKKTWFWNAKRLSFRVARHTPTIQKVGFPEADFCPVIACQAVQCPSGSSCWNHLPSVGVMCPIRKDIREIRICLNP